MAKRFFVHVTLKGFVNIFVFKTFFCENVSAVMHEMHEAQRVMLVLAFNDTVETSVMISICSE